MANDIRSSPWICDTASASPIKPGITWTTGFVFRDYTGGAASQAVFKDWRGIVIARLQGNVQGSPVGEGWLPAGHRSQTIRDLTLSAIDSGVVEVLVI
jgi:hypothetical protein